ncbi:MAG: hypothetical protein FGM24_08550 [Candidatus Kapabacteria bacterium]|nr:hypothetical protein [Candidatus Kapabacteria bacterium]
MALSLQQIGRTWPLALVASATLGLAPFMPEPHLVGKLRWVMGGAVGMQAVDWFDLVWHAWPFLWLGAALTARLMRNATSAAS